MENRALNLLDEALGLDHQTDPWPLCGKVVLVEDCVETSGCFVLHQLLKRTLSPQSPNNTIIFLAFSHSFSHYDRIVRKLGCNLVAQRENGRFFFFDMLKQLCPDEKEGKTGKGGFPALYRKMQKTIGALPENNQNHATIMIDDMSLMEVAAHGSLEHVLDFMHYCHTLTSEFGCSLITLNHEDIYSSMERPTFMLQMEYLTDVLIKVEPLATGLAADVHGQLTVLNRGICKVKGSSKNKISNFHFKVKENGVDYFYPGTRT
ncbi:unnamed protein product [Dovyalis caffra]|uniref:Elongator complex protein 6 n=1 Tax=Dovyalis caffra TaxID=77055 RepID=A0AAV1QV26_9ROSI|nr:unnamed protein product [Dovyalis caffra]